MFCLFNSLNEKIIWTNVTCWLEHSRTSCNRDVPFYLGILCTLCNTEHFYYFVQPLCRWPIVGLIVQSRYTCIWGSHINHEGGQHSIKANKYRCIYIYIKWQHWFGFYSTVWRAYACTSQEHWLKTTAYPHLA